jgi:hypothetical protein
MRIHSLLACVLTSCATGAFSADLTVGMGGMVNVGTSQTVDNVACMGTLEMTLGATVTATQSVSLNGCMLQLDVPMGSMVAMDIPIIVNMSMMANMGMFMGLPEGQQVMVGGMTRYITYQGGDGNDVMLLSTMPMMPMPMPMMPMPMMPRPGTNVRDMWWTPWENGWGMSIVVHGDTPFVTLFIYDANGKPTWVVMPAGAWDSTHAVYTGSIYAPSGTPFFAYDASRFKAGAAVGTVTLTFQDYNDAIIDYVIGGVSGRKGVMREMFADGPGMLQDRSDLWWGGMSQNGWGITIRQQASTLFLIWYTYDANGATTWYAMPGGTWTDASTYEGRLYRTTGSPWVGRDYDPAKLQVFDVGPYSIHFTGDAATLDYTVDGHTGSIALAREPF